MGPGNMGPDSMGPGNMGPGYMGPGDMGPRNMGSEERVLEVLWKESRGRTGSRTPLKQLLNGGFDSCFNTSFTAFIEQKNRERKRNRERETERQIDRQSERERERERERKRERWRYTVYYISAELHRRLELQRQQFLSELHTCRVTCHAITLSTPVHQS
ncbi:hypothetical protein FHG87_004866 [Trinorchestia longiramus]|nr:hypothetical protein FHG87_004866 [Trinorchestia longiramus]